MAKGWVGVAGWRASRARTRSRYGAADLALPAKDAAAVVRRLWTTAAKDGRLVVEPRQKDAPSRPRCCCCYYCNCSCSSSWLELLAWPRQQHVCCTLAETARRPARWGPGGKFAALRASFD